MQEIYLDHNATTPLHPEVARAIIECHRAGYANPASQHSAGRRARRVLEEARERIAGIVGAETERFEADQLIFTSGGTEANNLAVLGLARGEPGRVILSAIEHPSVAGAGEELARRGFDVRRLPVSSDGVVQVDRLPELLTPDTRLVSVMLGNNETGVLQPVEELAAICREANIPLHTDAVQVAGKLPLDFRGLGAAAMTLNAHKLHGPPGIGALVVRHGVKLDPVLYGGAQQLGLRPGTEPVALAVGMQKALELWREKGEHRTRHLEELRNRLEERLLAANIDVVINGCSAPRLPHVSNISFPGLNRQTLLMALDMAGVACSTGSACASGSSEPSPVLLAMGLSTARVEGSLRLSLGLFTRAAEIDRAAERILKAANNLRR